MIALSAKLRGPKSPDLGPYESGWELFPAFSSQLRPPRPGGRGRAHTCVLRFVAHARELTF